MSSHLTLSSSFSVAFFTEHLHAEDSKLAAKTPPPELLIQIARNMIHPNILPQYIAELLEILSNIEQWRIKVGERAALALGFDRYWDHYELPYPSGLTDSDRRDLQIIVDSREIIRPKFVEITRQYCHWVGRIH
jgi:hypothetical protein